MSACPRCWRAVFASAARIIKLQTGAIVTRKYVDCREMPSDMHCTIAISADNDQELLEAAVQHAVTVHHHEDSPDLRSQISKAMKEGMPPVHA